MSTGTQRQQDLDLLNHILAEGNAPELNGGEKKAFRDMLASLEARGGSNLTGAQRRWATEVWDKLKPLDIKKVPPGRPVPTPKVLQNPQEALKRKPPPPTPKR